MKSKPKIIIIVVAVILVATAGLGFWYWSKSKQVMPSKAPTLAPTLGSQLFDKTQPLQGQVPNTNPFKAQKNPFDTVYKNPFK